jgi:hypothetical protein
VGRSCVAGAERGPRARPSSARGPSARYGP